MQRLGGEYLVERGEADGGHQGPAPNSGAPLYPNCGRDWIICGRPSCGPWVEWNAMKNVPSRHPATTATLVHSRLPPRVMPSTPTARGARGASPENHNAQSAQNL